MVKQACIFVVFSIWLLFVLCAHETFANVFSSLHFTRQSLMQFSRGNERTVEILTPEKTTKTITNTAVIPKDIPLSILTSSVHRPHAGFGAVLIRKGSRGYSTARPKTAKIPVTETVVTYQKKRKVYRQRSSPSNKFLEVLNVIERAVANANSSGDENDAGTLSKLDKLVVKAVRSKRFHYGRQVSKFIVLTMAYMSHFDTKQSGFALYNFFYIITTQLGAKCPLTLPADCRPHFYG